MSEELVCYGKSPFEKSHNHFLTICTYGHRCTLGAITKGKCDTCIWKPSAWGNEICRAIQSMPVIYDEVGIDRFVVMPNHVHMIVRSHNNYEDKLRQFVIGWKSFTSEQLKKVKPAKHPVWSSEYTCRYLRNNTTYRAVSTYIHENPRKWHYDRFYSKRER